VKLPFDFPFGEAPHFGAPPFVCSPAEAQPFCSFVVLEPLELPAGVVLSACQVTPEGPGRASRVELTLAGAGRRLHLTQHHYDWWRPTSADSNLQRVQGAVRAGAHVLFWGRDARGRAAACATVGPTQVELTVERGTFVELELARLVARLGVALPAVVAACATTPFHRMSFHIRAGRGPDGIDELAAASWHSISAPLPALGPRPQVGPRRSQGRRPPAPPPLAGQPALPVPLLLPDLLPADWQLDSLAVWPSPPPSQLQWVLRTSTPFGPSIVLYARARPLNDKQPLPLPPALHAHSGWRLRPQRLGRTGPGRSWFGQQSSPLGGWLAVWEEISLGAAYQLFVRAAALPDAGAVLALVGSLRVAEGVGVS
jgi:hypothetical protein